MQPEGKLLSSSEGLNWSGLKLWQWEGVPPQEASEPLNQHMLLIHTTPQAVTTLEKAEGYRDEGLARPGDLNLISAGETTYCRWEKPLSFIRLELAPTLLQEVALQTRLANPDRLELPHRFRQQDERLLQLGHWLLDELRQDNPGGKLYAESLTNVLVVHLLRHYSVTSNSTFSTQALFSSQNRLSRQEVAQVIEYMRAHLAQDLSLEELGQAANLSPSYLVRLFKQTTGLAPHQYLIKLRVEQAKELLLDGKLSITQVAGAVGFTDQSHLHRHFKKWVGTTPKAFVS
jgi:AraC family transcriptional regulator